MIEHRYLMDIHPADGWELNKAIAAVLPEVRGAGWAIAPVQTGFIIRGPTSAPTIQSLMLGERRARVEHSESVELEPALRLASPLVVTRLRIDIPDDQVAFHAKVAAQITARATELGAVSTDVSTEVRRTSVRDHGLRGFAVRVRTARRTAALEILRYGIGHHRAMGCGVFFPVTE